MMSQKLYLSKLEKKYKIVYLHNPKHFFLNTLFIENLSDGRKLLCAYPRPHNKNFHRLAILKPLNKNKEPQYKLPFTEGASLNSLLTLKSESLK